MIERNLLKYLLEAAQYYPVVTLTGPRQSGKTTLCRRAFPNHAYVSFESLDVRERARQDPRDLLSQYSGGAIFDEIQHAPELVSYLQEEVDARPDPGRFILTGSQHLGITAAISQSLAGRTAVLQLFPPSYDELERFVDSPDDLWDVLWTGAYPRIHDQKIPPSRWLADYLATYVQRDVRQITNVSDLQAFTDFTRLCAGCSACELNLSRLGSDAGVSHNTARSWLSVLEASYLVFRAPAWYRHIKKQVIKAPKLYFLDSGLACHLLGIREPFQLQHHPLRGPVFESWVAAELYKSVAHRGLTPQPYHFRTAKGLEVDLLLQGPQGLDLVEAKSGKTVHSDFFAPLDAAAALIAKVCPGQELRQFVVYGGNERQRRQQTSVLPWNVVSTALWTDDGGNDPLGAGRRRPGG